MTKPVTLDEARALLGKDLYGPQELASIFGPLDPKAAELPIPYSLADIEAAKKAGEILILRIASAADGQPITIIRMIEKAPQAFDRDLLQKAGYQLKSDWGIELEPLAQKNTCRQGWSFVSKEILADTRNLSYDEQTPCLREYAARLQVPTDSVRRRTATEAVFDTVVAFVSRGERLLEKSWDWTSSETADGGFLNVGGFGPKGMQALSFSGAVRHDALGICPTRGLQG